MSESISYAFASDTYAPVAAFVLDAIRRANVDGQHASYGHDQVTERLRKNISRLFDQDLFTLLVPTGTGSNVLAMANLVGPAESILLAETAHMYIDECAAVERATGAKLVPIPTVDGKLTAELIEAHRGDATMLNRPLASVVSISQPTELGTVYTYDELYRLSEYCVSHDLKLHIDGARFANAATSLGILSVGLLKHCYFDALSFGFTKNGGYLADLLVLSDIRGQKQKDHARRLQSQLMQLPAKMWGMSASIEVMLEDGLWLDLANTANKSAHELAMGIGQIAGRQAIGQPVETNVVFCRFSQPIIDALRKHYKFYVWSTGDVRLMTSWDTKPESIDRFLEDLREIVRAQRT